MQECDDLLVSISANWQTIPELESAVNTDSGAGFDLEVNETIYKSREDLMSNYGEAEYAQT